MVCVLKTMEKLLLLASEVLPLLSTRFHGVMQSLICPTAEGAIVLLTVLLSGPNRLGPEQEWKPECALYSDTSANEYNSFRNHIR